MKTKEAKKSLDNFNKIPKTKINRTFMEISGYPHYENVCSNILAFFFETKNEHNLRDLFIKSLLQAYWGDINVKKEIETISVEREFYTINRNRLDLLIETDEYIIGIENKIFHFLNNDLKDYEETIDEKEADRTKKVSIKIVLSLNELHDTEIEGNDFKNITYSDFFNKINSNIGDYIIAGDIEYLMYLKGFIATINNLRGNIVESELNTFFNENSTQIDELVKSYSEFTEKIRNMRYPKLQYLMEELMKVPNQKWWIYKKEVLGCEVNINGHTIGVESYYKNNNNNYFGNFIINVCTWEQNDWKVLKNHIFKLCNNNNRVKEGNKNIVLYKTIEYDDNNEKHELTELRNLLTKIEEIKQQK